MVSFLYARRLLGARRLMSRIGHRYAWAIRRSFRSGLMQKAWPTTESIGTSEKESE
jgi:hypothetical protein